MQTEITYVGIDAHKDTLWIAMLKPSAKDVVEWKVENKDAAVVRLAKRLVGNGATEVRACYEAGPTGYELQRMLEGHGVICEVVAPSLSFQPKPVIALRPTSGMPRSLPCFCARAC